MSISMSMCLNKAHWEQLNNPPIRFKLVRMWGDKVQIHSIVATSFGGDATNFVRDDLTYDNAKAWALKQGWVEDGTVV
jgi:hypothetical protein